MAKVDFDSAVEAIIAHDPRYAVAAYAFVRDSLDHTIHRMAQQRSSTVEHVDGPDLVQGFRDYALKQFGPMVPTILAEWGLTCTRDIGEIVFSLIHAGVFSKSDRDRVEDFENIYDFEQAFVQPFLPKGRRSSVRKGQAG